MQLGATRPAFLNLALATSALLFIHPAEARRQSGFVPDVTDISLCYENVYYAQRAQIREHPETEREFKEVLRAGCDAIEQIYNVDPDGIRVRGKSITAALLNQEGPPVYVYKIVDPFDLQLKLSNTRLTFTKKKLFVDIDGVPTSAGATNQTMPTDWIEIQLDDWHQASQAPDAAILHQGLILHELFGLETLELNTTEVTEQVRTRTEQAKKDNAIPRAAEFSRAMIMENSQTPLPPLSEWKELLCEPSIPGFGPHPPTRTQTAFDAAVIEGKLVLTGAAPEEIQKLQVNIPQGSPGPASPIFFKSGFDSNSARWAIELSAYLHNPQQNYLSSGNFRRLPQALITPEVLPKLMRESPGLSRESVERGVRAFAYLICTNQTPSQSVKKLTQAAIPPKKKRPTVRVALAQRALPRKSSCLKGQSCYPKKDVRLKKRPDRSAGIRETGGRVRRGPRLPTC